MDPTPAPAAPAAAPPATPPAGGTPPAVEPQPGATPPAAAPAAPPGTPPAVQSSIFQEGDGHNFNPGWSGEHAPFVDRFQTPQDLAKGYAELHRSMSAGERMTNIASYPGEDNPAGRAQWEQTMGVPEDPSGYNLDKLQLPEGMAIPPEMAANYSQMFKDVGMPPEMAAAMVPKYLELTTKMEADAAAHKQVQDQANLQVEQAKLMQKYGDNLGPLQAKAGQFLQSRGHNLSEEQMNDPAVAGAILDLMAQTGEDPLAQDFGGAGTSVPNQNAAQRVRTIQEQASQIRQGVDVPNADPLAKGYAEGDDEAVKQFRALTSQLASR